MVHHVCIYVYIFILSPSALLFHSGIDNVDDLMADIAEQQEVAHEISDAISRPFAFSEDFDEVSPSQDDWACYN